jgi:hypothetical protein
MQWPERKLNSGWVSSVNLHGWVPLNEHLQLASVALHDQSLHTSPVSPAWCCTALTQEKPPVFDEQSRLLPLLYNEEPRHNKKLVLSTCEEGNCMS